MNDGPPKTLQGEKDARGFTEPKSLRVPPYAGGGEPPTIAVVRARARAFSHALELITDDDTGDSLTLGEGVRREAESALGAANTAVALRAVASLGDAPFARGIRARAALMGGDVDAARAFLGADPADRSHPDLTLADAALALAEADLGRAAARIEEALARDPHSLAVRYTHGLLHVARGDMHEAQLCLQEVARAHPEHAVARYQLGQILLAAGDPARAGTLFEMAFVTAPTFAAPGLALAEMLSESRQYADALALVTAVIEANPEALGPRLLQLRILLEVGEHEAAMGLARMLHERAPHDAGVTLLYAEALTEAESVGEARALIDGLLGQPNLDTGVVQRARRQLARIALAERPPRPEDAITLLRDAARAGGRGAGELAIELFHVAMAIGRRQEAEASLELVEQVGDVSALVSGAILARSHALFPAARRLGEAARHHVLGTPAESQLDGFLASLP